MERELNDQASSLRKIAWEKGRGATYLSVSSGKGGVGKTTFTVNLACLLAKSGKKVLVFDADLGLANIDIMLKVAPQVNIRRYMSGESSIEEVLIKGVYGFDLFPASSGVLELAELSDGDFEKIKQILVALDHKYDFIIFDTGAGIANNVHRFAAMADHVIVVTQPEPTAIADAYAFIKTAKQLYPVSCVQIVFNRVDSIPSAQKVYENLKGVVQKFLQVDLKLIAHLSEDADARRAVRGQKPLCMIMPYSPFVEGVRALASKADMIWHKQPAQVKP